MINSINLFHNASERNTVAQLESFHPNTNKSFWKKKLEENKIGR